MRGPIRATERRMIALEKLFEIAATTACGIFTGAALYINLVEHPARMSCGVRLAATGFGPSYHRAAVMQASLAIFGFVAATSAWFAGADYLWLVGGILLVAVVPFTLLVIMPINKKLLAPDLDKDSDDARDLLTKWNRLHAVRSLLSLIAFLIFVVIR
jgi:uncharacterized membrane protein